MEPTINVPGRTEPMTRERDPNFPKMVYTAGLTAHLIIKCEEERPEGYYDHAEAKDMEPDMEPPAAPTADHQQAVFEAEQAKREAKLAEKEHRKALQAYLDEHNVDYNKRISTAKLEELKVALDEHLGQQDVTDDSEQHTDPSGVS
jgi:hypothetical protein